MTFPPFEEDLHLQDITPLRVARVYTDIFDGERKKLPLLLVLVHTP
jgi:hypothetical protein